VYTGITVGDAGGHNGSDSGRSASNKPSDPPQSRLSHSSSSSHRGHVYTTISVGDAGGHDGSEKQGVSLQISHITHRYRPTTARAVAQFQQLPQGACVHRDYGGRRRRPRRYGPRFGRWRLVSLQISHLTHRYRPTTARAVAQLQQLSQVQLQTRFSWETPEVTTVRAAIRTNAMHESFAAAPNRAVAPPTLATQFVDSNTGNSSQTPVFACLKTRHGLCNSPVPGL
jgi:hypothetical protein